MNGNMILKALKEIGEPTSFSALVAYIARKTREDPDLVEETVMSNLIEGVRLGFISRANQKYFTQILDAGDKDKMNNMESENDSHKENSDNEGEYAPSDCRRRRKRSSVRSGKRSRSRRRRRH